MAVPKRKVSPSRRGNRRAHDALKLVHISYDKDGEPHVSHHASPRNGNYDGRSVYVTKAHKRMLKAEAAEAAEPSSPAESA